MDTQLLMAALAGCRDGIVITDAISPKNQIIYTNKAFQLMTGFSESDLIGKGSRFLLGTKTRPTAAKAFRQALGEGSRVQVTLSAICKDGSQKWLEISGGPFEYNGEKKRYFIGSCRDVGERVEAVEALMASEIKFEKSDVEAKVSSYDSITSLYNRSYFEEVAEREWLAMLRERRPLSVFLIGISNLAGFKASRGLDNSNRLMANTADALRQVFRRGIDLVAKYDDERFIVISTGMAWEEAENMAAKLNDVVDGELAQNTPIEARLYGCIGVATKIPEEGFHVDHLIELAEQALLKASTYPESTIIVAESDCVA
ncbi:sensor domain-containing diguanylate cyclase [Alkalimarinus alittae]|uniref:Diguanylate cyclase n=1 Tax=Alkalimarinus alittae TaxID=2961619 RepID=A0ABY6N1Z9_9ALTE|nr:diguanylate cyclase [Alkalimarinus alittae]UZE96106.1 diguanylate cyclase [Alkalimarinus alittae]